uniref:hypothetical protein n=1 Tax=uncultured Dysgonomonas sp. TaxID=206096 RepID=UPI002611954C|nr:hypothetical protein [uncultured Dysgonomonas sp.]
MSNITTLEQVKRLKKLGFNRQAFTYWELEDEIWGMTRTLNPDFDKGFIEYPEEGCIIIPATTIPEALDWIREEFNLMCGIHPAMRPSTTIDNPKWASYKWSIMEYNRDVETGMNEVQYIERNEWFDTHHLAESALLDAVLTYLENKGGE